MAIIDLVSGFLGAGKTTFIQHYAAWLKANGQRPIVIENEFGILNIDSAILKGNGLEVENLSGGCICCGLKKNFRALLARLCTADIRIVVEPSGIFNPHDFFSLISEPGLRDHLQLGAMITIIDPFSFYDIDDKSRELMREQMLCAGSLLLSRTGRMSKNEVDEAERHIQRLINTPEERQIHVRPWDEFSDEDFNHFSCVQPNHSDANSRYVEHVLLYESVSIHCNRRQNIEEIQTSIAMAFQESDGMIRLKGFVPSQDGEFWEVNCTRHDKSIIKSPNKARPFIVAIGQRMERGKIETLFRQLS